MPARCPYCETSRFNCECKRCSACTERIITEGDTTEGITEAECSIGGDHFGLVFCSDCCDESYHDDADEDSGCTYCQWCDTDLDCDGEPECDEHDHGSYDILCKNCCEDEFCPLCHQHPSSVVCPVSNEKCQRCGSAITSCSCEPGQQLLRIYAGLRAATERPCNTTEDFTGNGFYCTRPEGHEGSHVAHGGSRVLAIWTASDVSIYDYKDPLVWRRWPAGLKPNEPGEEDETFEKCQRCQSDIDSCSCKPPALLMLEYKNAFRQQGKTPCRTRDPLSRRSLICTREAGHSGNHVAHYSSKEVLTVWTDDGSILIYHNRDDKAWKRHPRGTEAGLK